MYNLLNVIARPRRRPNIDGRVRVRPRGDGVAPLWRGRGLVEAGAEVHADRPRGALQRSNTRIFVGPHHADRRREVVLDGVAEAPQSRHGRR